jgi:YHS domain-containing protein
MNESKTMTQDPVCGMPVEEATALYDKHDGKTFYFCSYFCRHEFLAKGLLANFAEQSESTHG